MEAFAAKAPEAKWMRRGLRAKRPAANGALQPRRTAEERAAGRGLLAWKGFVFRWQGVVFRFPPKTGLALFPLCLGVWTSAFGPMLCDVHGGTAPPAGGGFSLVGWRANTKVSKTRTVMDPFEHLSHDGPWWMFDHGLVRRLHAKTFVCLFLCFFVSLFLSLFVCLCGYVIDLI